MITKIKYEGIGYEKKDEGIGYEKKRWKDWFRKLKMKVLVTKNKDYRKDYEKNIT